jgi:hypothetical protein
MVKYNLKSKKNRGAQMGFDIFSDHIIQSNNALSRNAIISISASLSTWPCA